MAAASPYGTAAAPELECQPHNEPMNPLRVSQARAIAEIGRMPDDAKEVLCVLNTECGLVSCIGSASILHASVYFTTSPKPRFT